MNKNEWRRWHRQEPSNESPTDKFVRRTANATWVLAAVTAALAITSGVTIYILLNQLAEMRNEDRAWVGVDKVNSFNWKVGPQFSVPFDVTNSGGTPALRVKMDVTLKSIPKGRKFTPTYSGPYPYKNSVTVIQPGMHVILSTLPIDVSKSAYNDIQDGRGILYAYGEITYRDIYWQRHQTNFCIMYYAGLTTPSACDAYNSAT